MAISTGSSGKGKVNADINVTPMIDVMLVLLIIFMIVTPVLASGFQATMPSGLNVDARAEGDDEITLGLDNQGNYFIDMKPIAKDQAEAQLKSMYATRTLDKILFFKADIGLPYSKVQEAVEMGRRAGARVLVAITDRKGGLSSVPKDKEK
ncbi:MAG: biopolymer transporter ExbD [Gemmatimonadales bacterium]